MELRVPFKRTTHSGYVFYRINMTYNYGVNNLGEMIVGPTKTIFMDEISTGLDSSTTFQIVKCLQQVAHLGKTTILMSLLQRAPETFDLFDDIILLSDGIIVYQGPKEHVLEFFETCGFSYPERKGAADFLQEIMDYGGRGRYSNTNASSVQELVHT